MPSGLQTWKLPPKRDGAVGIQRLKSVEEVNPQKWLVEKREFHSLTR